MLVNNESFRQEEDVLYDNGFVKLKIEKIGLV